MSEKKTCEACGKELSRSGYYKHIKTCKPSVDPADLPEPPKSDWRDYTPFESGSAPTHNIPPTVKLLSGKRKTGPLTKEEREAAVAKNIALLKTLLSGYDAAVSVYGRKVTGDDEFKVRHSDADKHAVACAQWEYLDSKDISPSDYIGPGLIAGVMTGYYVAPPLASIEAKRENPRRLFSKLKTGIAALRAKRKLKKKAKRDRKRGSPPDPVVVE